MSYVRIVLSCLVGVALACGDEGIGAAPRSSSAVLAGIVQMCSGHDGAPMNVRESEVERHIARGDYPAPCDDVEPDCDRPGTHEEEERQPLDCARGEKGCERERTE